MANIIVKRNSPHPPEETFQRLKKVLDDDKDLRALDASYKCTFEDSNLKGNAKGSKFQANLEVLESNGHCEVKIEVKLALLLTPFKSMVESTLSKKVEKALS